MTASTDAAAAQLLKGLMDEDQKLFHDDTPLFDFSSAEENEGTDEATRELLEEIDRSLKGFERAARTNSWLGELGVNAENRLLAEAQTARELGQRVSAVDLANFAIDAVNLHGGEVQQTDNPDIFTLRLPPAWSYGLNELPGYDADNRLLRLTTNLDIASDERQNSVGFLGRAHPLVRRALDRVRNLSFGGTSGQDPRASAVKADIPTPTLLFTYLGRVSSKAGRELERVLAVKIDCEGTTEFYDASNWLDFADRKRAIKTTDIWKQHFQSWGDAAVKQAQQVAQTKFLPIAEAFIQGWQRDLAVERSRQDEWFKQRVNDIIAEPESLVEQLDLFSFTQTAATEAIAPSTWRSLSDPAERLEGVMHFLNPQIV